jgi:hypothetical protein
LTAPDSPSLVAPTGENLVRSQRWLKLVDSSRESLGVEGEVTVDVAFRADAWSTQRHDWAPPDPDAFTLIK